MKLFLLLHSVPITDFSLLWNLAVTPSTIVVGFRGGRGNNVLGLYGIRSPKHNANATVFFQKNEVSPSHCSEDKTAKATVNYDGDDHDGYSDEKKTTTLACGYVVLPDRRYVGDVDDVGCWGRRIC